MYSENHGVPVEAARTVPIRTLSIVRPQTLPRLQGQWTRVLGDKQQEAPAGDAGALSLHTVSRLLGHSGIRTSMIYAKARMDTLQEAVDRLELNSGREHVGK